MIFTCDGNTAGKSFCFSIHQAAYAAVHKTISGSEENGKGSCDFYFRGYKQVYGTVRIIGTRFIHIEWGIHYGAEGYAAGSVFHFIIHESDFRGKRDSFRQRDHISYRKPRRIGDRTVVAPGVMKTKPEPGVICIVIVHLQSVGHTWGEVAVVDA